MPVLLHGGEGGERPAIEGTADADPVKAEVGAALLVKQGIPLRVQHEIERPAIDPAVDRALLDFVEGRKNEVPDKWY